MLNVTVHCLNGVRIEIKNKFLKQIAEFVCSEQIEKNKPLKLVFKSGKMLYIDKQVFESYSSGKITEKEFIEQTECDELYRNIYEIETKDGTLIDPDSLWKCKNRILTLIDDDFHASFILNEMEFCIAE